MQCRRPLASEQISMDRRRTELKGPDYENTGKALRMCVSANVLNAIFNDCYPPKGERTRGIFHADSEYRPVKMQNLRLALPSMFREEKAMKAIDELNLSKERTNAESCAESDDGPAFCGG